MKIQIDPKSMLVGGVLAAALLLTTGANSGGNSISSVTTWSDRGNTFEYLIFHDSRGEMAVTPRYRHDGSLSLTNALGHGMFNNP